MVCVLSFLDPRVFIDGKSTKQDFLPSTGSGMTRPAKEAYTIEEAVTKVVDLRAARFVRLLLAPVCFRDQAALRTRLSPQSSDALKPVLESCSAGSPNPGRRLCSASPVASSVAGIKCSHPPGTRFKTGFRTPARSLLGHANAQPKDQSPSQFGRTLRFVPARTGRTVPSFSLRTSTRHSHSHRSKRRARFSLASDSCTRRVFFPYASLGGQRRGVFVG